MIQDFTSNDIFAIIPARGGSKGLPGKNIKLFCGKPLLAWTIEAAKLSSYIGKVIVSTDSEQIAQTARDFGAEVPFLRPQELSTDDSDTVSVTLHALSCLKKDNYEPKLLVLLQPTSPLRLTEDIDNAIELFLGNGCDAVISVNKLQHPIFWTFRISNSYLDPLFGRDYLASRRQELPEIYAPNGAIYIVSIDAFLKHKSFYLDMTRPYVMPFQRSIDIDDEDDFLVAERFMANRIKSG
jgi:CMP-N-acetylneuraminic acid synthetase